MVKISKTSKLGCLSWSLQALDTCPGSKSATGGLVPACSGCYATTGNYRYPNVIAPREHNRTDWERDDWADDMVAALAKETHFRWFDSGDMYSVELARKMLDVMRRTPWCKHWLPTRMHKFAKFQAIIRDMQALPNVMVRPSSDDIDGTYTAGIHGSTIIPNADDAPTGVTVCGAYSREGKCGPCRACWDKTVAVIAYPAHGQKMAKVIRLALAA
jgi:Gene product 88